MITGKHGQVYSSHGKKVLINVLLDGVDHINVSSYGSTDEGRILSPHAKRPFTHPTLGEFYSLFGFLMFLRSGKRCNRFRTQYGTTSNGTAAHVVATGYEDEFLEGMKVQYETHDDLMDALRAVGTLPIVNYYLVGTNIKDNKSHRLILEGMTIIRLAELDKAIND